MGLRTVNNYCSIYLYCHKLNRYFNDGYKLYSLGSSLEKLNFIWNMKNIDSEKQINIIPFSGNILNHPAEYTDQEMETIDSDIKDHIKQYYDKLLPTDYESKPIEYDMTHFLINHDARERSLSNYENLLKNNPNFNDMVTKLQNGEKVVITDVMSRGKSLYTLLLLLQYYGVSMINLYFLYIMEYQSSLSEIQLYINTIKYNLNIFNIEFDINNIDFIPELYLSAIYFQNSEHTNSRCTPKYGNSKWNKPLDDVYIEVEPDKRNGFGGPNYINCNMHKILYYMYTSCFYDNFILPKLSVDVDTNNMMAIMKEIRDFLDITTYHNIMEGYDKKYLKYKTKYLKLKQKIKTKN